MKRHFNFSASIAASLVLASLASPWAASATTTQTLHRNGAGVCNRIAEYRSKVGSNFVDQLSRFEQNKADQLKRLADNRADRNRRLAASRALWDKNRIERFEKLGERATTTAEQQAVAAFKNTVTTAIAARRGAVDAALAAFRSGVDKAVADRRAAVENARKTLQSAADAAFAKAAADCANGIDSQTVRTALQQSLKAARQQFATTVRGLDKVGTALQALTDARNAAIKKAHDDFQAAFDKAVTDLRAALKA